MPKCGHNMRRLHTLLVCCCCVWWVAAARRVGYDATLDLSSEASSLSEGNGDIHERSLSPWTWRISTVPTRIPPTLWEAECSSSVCLFPHKEGQRVDLGLSVVPIYQDILVLQREQGRRYFTTSFQRVAVGCTCVRARSSDT